MTSSSSSSAVAEVDVSTHDDTDAGPALRQAQDDMGSGPDNFADPDPDPKSDSSQDYRELWLKILGEVSKELPRTSFITWFRDTAILGIEDGKLIVGLPLMITMNYHLEHYRALVLKCATQIDSQIQSLVYSVDGSLKDDLKRTVDLLEHFPDGVKKRKLPGKQEVKLAEGIISKILNPRYRLENFVVGTSNRLAHAACDAVAQQPGGKYNPLFLYGGVGLGKTHLLQAVGNAILKKMPKCAVVYVTSEDFTNEVVEAIRASKMERVRQRYRKVDVLVIDDVQFLASKERTQEEFFHTFNTLFEEGKQIIISADRAPDELLLEDRLISRFSRGMIADLSKPDFETRLAILMEKAQEYELLLDAKVLEHIAENVTTNVRDLEGILMQAVAQYELEQRMPTVSSIAAIMGKLRRSSQHKEESVGFELPPEKKASFPEILESVSAYYSVSVQDMVGLSRVRQIIVPRHIAMHLGRKHLDMSFASIGSVFSDRDHTTVMHAVRKIEKEITGDPQLLREIRAIESDVGLKRR